MPASIVLRVPGTKCIKINPMRPVSKLILILIVSLVFGCTASRIYQPRRIDTQSEYIHKDTRTSFPVEWEGYKRKSLTTFNKGKTNICADYVLSNSSQDIKISVYVYPAPDAIEHRIRDEYLDCLQDIATISNSEIKTSPKHIRVSKSGYKVLGLSSVINSEKYKTVLVLFECGEYFLKYRISSSVADTSVLVDISNQLTDKFSPIDIVRTKPLIQDITIHIAPGIVSDTSNLDAVLAAALAKTKWVNQNIDSLERCSGFPGLYFEEQKVSIDSMLNKWMAVKHNNTINDKFFDDLVDIRMSGFLNEFICDQYWNTLLLPDSVKLDWDNYEIWKSINNPTVKLVGEYYYLIGYED